MRKSGKTDRKATGKNDFVRRLYPTAAPRSVRSRTVPPGDGRHDRRKLTPESVATQVVAGTNYRFICTAITATPGPETYEAEIIVFQPLPGQGEAKIAKITRL